MIGLGTRTGRILLGLVITSAMAVGVLWIVSREPLPPPSPADRELGLEHASVYMHLVLRERLAGDDPQELAAQLSRVVESRRAADQMATELFEARGDGARILVDRAEHGPILSPLGAPSLDTDTERAMLLLAYVVASGRHEDAGSVQIATYEASRLDPEELPESLRGLAEAARSLAFSSGNHCERARASAASSSRGPTAEDLEAWLEGVDAQAVADDLEYARRLLNDGALACCALRERDRAESARLIQATALDAQELGLATERVLLLQAFAATARGDLRAARDLAGEIAPASLAERDRQRHRMLRDAIAASREDGLDDARVRLADRDWLVSAMLEAVVDALERDGLLAHLESRPEAEVARRFLAAEARILEVARDRYPFFEQAHMNVD